jgi:hypothetical protein
MKRHVLLALSFGALASSAASSAIADELPPAHGPAAPDRQFPSHRFTLAAHQPERVQLAVHYGLLQPILLHGFNAAVDVRWRRLVATYSHGAGLDVTSALSDSEKHAGLTLREPWTTGGGVGVLLIDELWVLADVKVHHFEPELAAERASYTTMTLGGEVGWRFFVWKGFNIGVVGRYWPNVWSSAKNGVPLTSSSGQPFVHQPAHQGASGLFANVLVGWAFGL